MSGLNFVCDLSGRLADRRQLHDQLLNNQMFDTDYRSEILFEDPRSVLSFSGFGEYPVERFENDLYIIVLEGRIYDRKGDELEKHLVSLASEVMADDQDNDAVTSWLLDTDGEFIIFIRQKATGRMAILNDIFSLLPAYYLIADQFLSVSRDPRFVSEMGEVKSFDKLAVMEYLLFGYSLDRRTVIDKVFRMEPGCMICVDPDGESITRSVASEFNFDKKENRNRSRKRNVSELVALFSKACRDRFENYPGKVLISLSGGRDSRAVVAGLEHCSIPFEAVSFVDKGQIYRVDATVAERLSKMLGFKLTRIDLGEPLGSDVLKLLRFKSGQVFLGASFALAYSRFVAKTYGRSAVLITGNGGHKTLPDIRSPEAVKNIEELAEYVVSCNRVMPTALVAELLDISEAEIFKHVQEVLAGYPETDIGQKYVHFSVYGRGLKRLIEGNDRQRFFVWSTSPFWSVHFFRYAMNCPDRQKKNGILYGQVIQALSPAAARMGCVKNNVPKPYSTLCEVRFYERWRRTIKSWPNPVRFLWKKVRKNSFQSKPARPKHRHPKAIMDCMAEQIDRCDAINEFISTSVVKDVINNSEDYNGAAMSRLFTMTSLIEDVTLGASSIEHHLDQILNSREEL